MGKPISSAPDLLIDWRGVESPSVRPGVSKFLEYLVRHGVKDSRKEA